MWTSRLLLQHRQALRLERSERLCRVAMTLATSHAMLTCGFRPAHTRSTDSPSRTLGSWNWTTVPARFSSTFVTTWHFAVGPYAPLARPTCSLALQGRSPYLSNEHLSAYLWL